MLTQKRSSKKYNIKNLLKFEDYWAIILGFAILLCTLFVFSINYTKSIKADLNNYNSILKAEGEKAPFKTIEWYEANDEKSSLKFTSIPFISQISELFSKPYSWNDDPLKSIYLSKEEASKLSAENEVKYEEAAANASSAKEIALNSQNAAAEANYKDEDLNIKAEEDINTWYELKGIEDSAKSESSIKPYNLIPSLIILGIVLCILFSIGIHFMGKSVKEFALGFPVVFIVAVLAYILASQVNLKAWGLEYVVWALLIGFLVSNTIGTPKIVLKASETEFFIKTGLVLLGSTVLINKMLLIGIPGIFVTWCVTPIVLITTYWFGQKILKIESKSLNITISADMSVSGVSAAIAAASASKAKKEELTLAVGISILFTSLMMVIMPLIIKKLGLNPVLAGAWIGGTVDSTGAVVAAGELLGPVARDVASTIKMIQNILIGVMAFGVATYWSLKVERNSTSEKNISAKVLFKEIWTNFPKFVLGFLFASILFSFIYFILGSDVANVFIDKGMVKSIISPLQGWLFCLAFASIGLSTNFRDLFKYFKGGKPIILYVCGQALNILLTFLAAYLMFNVVFTNITEKLLK